ncbi:MAG: DUF4124 domain-containing protein [Burkholderiales bacterium]|nr:DUF4124 domain-containing protein [Burkholderiales bacterium]
MVYSVVFLLVFGSMSFGTHSADMFKWVDEKGRIHYGESVPEQYKRSATHFEEKGAEPIDAKSQKAAASLAKDSAAPAKSKVRRQAKSNKPHSKSPALPVSSGSQDKGSSCEAEKRKYRESEACFAPYRNATGGIKAEAFKHCVEVKEPQC